MCRASAPSLVPRRAAGDGHVPDQVYKGSASLQLDAHTHQQEQDEIERLEGSRA